MQVCKLHGGASLIGAGSPTFKTGAHSKLKFARVLEDHQAERMVAFMKDPSLLEMKSHVALLDTRLEDQLAQLRDGGLAPLGWRQAVATYGEIRRSIPEDDAELCASMDALGKVLEANAAEAEIWDEALRTADVRRKVAASHALIERASRDYVTNQEILVLLHQTFDSFIGTVDAMLHRAAESLGLDLLSPEVQTIRRQALSEFGRRINETTGGRGEVN